MSALDERLADLDDAPGSIKSTVLELIGSSWEHLKDAQDGRGDGIGRAATDVQQAARILERLHQRLELMDDEQSEDVLRLVGGA